MLFKKVLLSVLLMGLTHGLGGANSAEEPAQPVGEPVVAGESLGVSAEGSVPPSRLSNLILPLPPLIVPELLLPPYDFPSFDSQRLDQALQIYLEYLRTHGKPDILIMGSSRSLQGIDPTALQEALAAQGYPDIKVFNLGINGATAQVMNLLVRDILAPDQLPRLIIWGDGSRAFNSGRPDRTFESIVRSQGYRQVQQGDRPIPSRTTEWEIPTFVTTHNKSLAASAQAALPDQPVAPDLDASGFQAVSERFNPESYYRQHPRVAGIYDNSYANFNLQGEQTQATVEVARFARQHGITLVVVNLPLTRSYLDPTRRRYEAQFQQHMWQLAARERFMFRDLSQQPELMQDGYFADPSHINRHGARAVAFFLAQDQTIPWSIVRPPAP
ncbi:MAG: hypothetical protein IGS38_08445 [Synechococcales cyanobacterium M58_A2018_015]|nr:hypothetical protein [Synechococcales cyanobacterium M58_A2018_015]